MTRMPRWRRSIKIPVCLAFFISCVSAADPAVLILVYHRFGSVRTDPMTVTTEHFQQQLNLLCNGKFSIIPLSQFLAWRLGRGPAPPPRSVVLTIDDGHVSTYRDARPIIVARHLPVTFFIYPSCISNASYAITWKQLRELIATPFFNVQSHTVWHPNFIHEARKREKRNYGAFVDEQLQHSRTTLQIKLKQPVDLLAWPFGIYDPFLISRAVAAGYQAGFSIDCRAATVSDPMMSLPRCLVSDEFVGTRFVQLIQAALDAARH